MSRNNMTKLQTQTRRAFVLRRKRAGDSHREVAERAEKELPSEVLPKSWGKAYVRQDISRVLQKRKEELDEEAEKYRTMMMDRLEELLSRLWPYTDAHEQTVVKGSGEDAVEFEITVPPDEKVVGRVLEIMDRLASFHGVDEAPDMPANKSQTNVFQQITQQYVEEMNL